LGGDHRAAYGRICSGVDTDGQHTQAPFKLRGGRGIKKGCPDNGSHVKGVEEAHQLKKSRGMVTLTNKGRNRLQQVGRGSGLLTFEANDGGRKKADVPSRR